MKQFSYCYSALSFISLLIACSPVKQYSIYEEIDLKEAAINLAIEDFSKKCWLFKKDSVFIITYHDSVFNKATELVRNKGEKPYKWQRGSFIEGVVCVGIMGKSDYQFYYSDNELNTHLPSRYKIIDDKLFCWWDANYSVTDEIVSILWKFNALQTYSIIPDYSINDKAKGADYYFRKDNVLRRKRVITSKAFGHYPPPRL